MEIPGNFLLLQVLMIYTTVVTQAVEQLFETGMRRERRNIIMVKVRPEHDLCVYLRVSLRKS